MLKKILIALAALVALAMAGIYIFADDFELTLSEAQVQTAIDRKLAQGDIKHLGVTLAPNAAQIDFKANNTAQLAIDFDVSGFGHGANMGGRLTSALRYDSPRLYLGQLDTSDLTFKLDPDLEQKTGDVKNVATDFLKRKRDEMLSDDAKESFDRLVGVNDEKIKAASAKSVQWFLNSVPIYDLNDAGYKGSLASLALKDVRFTEQSAIVTLSPRQAVIKILLFLGALLMGLIGGLIYYSIASVPERVIDAVIDKATQKQDNTST